MEDDKSLNFEVAVTGIFGALSIVLSITPFGFIQIGPLALTIMHIPVIAATVLAGLIPGVGVGLVFGIASLVRTLMMGNLWFNNPLVSILPRVLFPIIVWAVFRLLNKIPKFPKILSGAVAAAFGTFMHTVMVLGAIFILYFDSYVKTLGENFIDAPRSFKTFAGIIGGVLVSQGFAEMAIAVAVIVAIMGAIYIAENGKAKLSRLEKADSEK